MLKVLILKAIVPERKEWLFHFSLRDKYKQIHCPLHTAHRSPHLQNLNFQINWNNWIRFTIISIKINIPQICEWCPESWICWIGTNQNLRLIETLQLIKNSFSKNLVLKLINEIYFSIACVNISSSFVSIELTRRRKERRADYQIGVFVIIYVDCKQTRPKIFSQFSATNRTVHRCCLFAVMTIRQIININLKLKQTNKVLSNLFDILRIS